MNFNTYLASIDEQGCSKQRRKELYPDFRRLSKKEEKRNRRKTIKRLEIRVLLSFYERLQNDAKTLKISVHKLLLNFIENFYDRRIYIFISHSLSKQIRWEINKIGTNINRCIRVINTRKHNEVYKSDIEAIKKDFLRLENYYLSYCAPIDFESLLRREHARNSEFLNHIEIMISAIRKETSNTSNYATD